MKDAVAIAYLAGLWVAETLQDPGRERDCAEVLMWFKSRSSQGRNVRQLCQVWRGGGVWQSLAYLSSAKGRMARIR